MKKIRNKYKRRFVANINFMFRMPLNKIDRVVRMHVIVYHVPPQLTRAPMKGDYYYSVIY